MATKKNKKFTKPTRFVVTKADFEYNDEVHSKNEGGIPLEIYSSRESAEREALKKNKEWLREISPFQYLYDFRDEFTDKQLSQLTRLGLDLNSRLDECAFASLPDEALQILMEASIFKCFEVWEVEESEE